MSFVIIRTSPMVKQRNLIVNTATANSVFLLRAQDSNIFHHVPTNQVRPHLHLLLRRSAAVHLQTLQQQTVTVGTETNVTSHCDSGQYNGICISFVQVQVLVLLIIRRSEIPLCRRGSRCQKREHANITNRAIAG